MLGSTAGPSFYVAFDVIMRRSVPHATGGGNPRRAAYSYATAVTSNFVAVRPGVPGSPLGPAIPPNALR